tara:strand:+ start:562 stop:726 length:165 start_codon:yes stop_codon:yes gene_type:complete
MEKTKEIKQDVKSNGEVQKLSRDEMIKKVEKEIADIVKMYHQKTGYLAGLKETD